VLQSVYLQLQENALVDIGVSQEQLKQLLVLKTQIMGLAELVVIAFKDLFLRLNVLKDIIRISLHKANVKNAPQSNIVE
jgi:hypothetical protein